MNLLKKEYFDFFIELAANNNRDWFTANKKRYENEVKIPFEKFVQSIIEELTPLNPDFKDLTAKECVFRINRDIRFSKDKTPYKLNCSALIVPNGKKSHRLDGLYIEVSPEKFGVYAGLYEPDKDQIELIRYAILNQNEEFNVLLNQTEFKQTFGEVLGEKNKILPKNFKSYSEIHPLVYNKQWYVNALFKTDLVLTTKSIEKLKEVYTTVLPFLTFLENGIK